MKVRFAENHIRFRISKNEIHLLSEEKKISLNLLVGDSILEITVLVTDSLCCLLYENTKISLYLPPHRIDELKIKNQLSFNHQNLQKSNSVTVISVEIDKW